MWSPDRRSLLILPLLAACGFTPAYGPQGQAAALTGRIAPRAATGRAEFDFVRRFEERMGRPEAPYWRLDYTITLQTRAAELTTESAISRYHLTGRVDWQLVPLAEGAGPLNGTAQSFTAWAATGSTVAVRAAEEDAQLRLMRILADQIVTQLIAGAGRIAPPAP